MCLEVETVEKVTLACCVLHNYLIECGETSTDSAGNAQSNSNTPASSSNLPYNPRKGEAENIRHSFLQYFNEEGKLEWIN